MISRVIVKIRSTGLYYHQQRKRKTRYSIRMIYEYKSTINYARDRRSKIVITSDSWWPPITFRL